MSTVNSIPGPKAASVSPILKSGHECPAAAQTIDLYDRSLAAVNAASYGTYRHGGKDFNVYNVGADKVVEVHGRPLVDGIGKGFKDQKFTLQQDGRLAIALGGARPKYTMAKAYYHTSLGRGLVKAVSSSDIEFSPAQGGLTMRSTDRTDFVDTFLHTYWFHGVDPEEWSSRVTVRSDGSAVVNDGNGDQEYPAR